MREPNTAQELRIPLTGGEGVFPGAEIRKGRVYDSMFKVGDQAVYPAYGVGTIASIENKEIFGNTHSFYILRIPDKEMTIMVPRTNAENVGMRQVIPRRKVRDVYRVLRGQMTDMDTTTSWNRRHREYMDRIKTVDVFEIAAVLRDLYLLKLDKDLSFGERKVFDTAKGLLVQELSVAKESHEEKVEAEVMKILSEPPPVPPKRAKKANGRGNGKGTGKANGRSNGRGNGKGTSRSKR